MVETVFIADAVLFGSGLLFGLAVKKFFKAIILFIVGGILAAYAGISLVASYANPAAIGSRLAALAVTYGSMFWLLFVALPLLFLAGLAIGLWKG